MDAIKATLASIRRPEFQTDAGLRVFDWRDPQSEPLQPKELPCCTMRDPTEDITAISASVHEHILSLELGAYAAEGDTTQDAIRALDADLKQALGVMHDAFRAADPQTAFHIQPSQGIMEVRLGGRRVGGIRINAEVRYRTAAFDPYTPVTPPA